jgi:hypothetical protein
MKLNSLLLSLSLAAFTGAAQADDAAKKARTDTQAKPAASQSGAASAGAGAATRYDFDKADTNKDGVLSREEFNAMMKGQRSAAAGSGTAAKDKPRPGAASGATMPRKEKQ